MKKIKHLLLILFITLFFNSCYFYYGEPPTGQYVIVQKYVYYHGGVYPDFGRYQTGAKYYVVVSYNGIYHTYMVSNYTAWYNYKCGGYYYVY